MLEVGGSPENQKSPDDEAVEVAGELSLRGAMFVLFISPLEWRKREIERIEGRAPMVVNRREGKN